MMVRDSDCRGAMATPSPSAPSRPIVADSIAAPLSIKVISETTQLFGK
jgi:hypothetical protein